MEIRESETRLNDPNPKIWKKFPKEINEKTTKYVWYCNHYQTAELGKQLKTLSTFAQYLASADYNM